MDNFKKIAFLAKYGSGEHLQKAIDMTDEYDAQVFTQAAKKIVKHPEFSKEHQESLFGRRMLPDRHKKELQLLSPHTDTKVFDDALADTKNADLEFKGSAMAQQRASLEGFKSAMKDPDYRLRRVAVLHDKTGSLLDTAMYDSHPLVRAMALQHTKTTRKHIEHLKNDPDEMVRKTAIKTEQEWDRITK